jgi:acyl-CoA synthetase (NDP forming)
MSLNHLFDARSIAIVGASDDPERIGGRPLAYLRNTWLTREDRAVYPVNPTRPEVQGLRSYPSMSAIGAPIDLAIIAVPAARIEDAIVDCCQSGCKAAIIFSSGFGELGEAGRLRQERMHKTAGEAGMRLLGPNCLGVIDVRQGMYATFSEAARDQNHAPGFISVASQSGAVAVQLLMLGRRLGIGMNKLISTGNEEDIDVAESIAYLAGDATTKVIIAYLEGCRDGNRLVDALQLAQARGKPVIVVKVGRSVSGSQATLSHTGSLAGEDRIYDAVFRQYGAYRADSFDEAMDVATIFASAGPAQGNRIGLLSISGGVGAMMADTAEACGLDVAPIRPSAAADSLRELASFSTVQNPLDITAQAINDMSLWRKNLEVMLGGRGYDVLVAFLTFVGESPRLFDPVVESMAQARAAYPDIPIVFCSLCTPAARAKATEMGFVVLEDAVRAVRAVAGWTKLGMAKRNEAGASIRSDVPPIVAAEAVNEFEAKRALARAGIRIPVERLAASRDAAIAAAREIGFPVVLKICSADLPHKTEIGGVALRLTDPDAVAAAYDRIIANVAERAPTARIDGMIVAEQLQAGVEMILGAQQDHLFGTMIMLGFGGILVEVVKDVALRRAPLSETDVAGMIGELRANALLQGVRGQAPSDIAALRAAVVSFAELARASRIRSIEINPLLVLPSGSGVAALDCLIEGGEEQPRKGAVS